MTRQLERAPGETVPEFAKRMSDLVHLILGIVQSEAGIGYDADDVIEELRFIVKHAADDNWDKCWELKVEIERVISRTTDVNRLQRILYFAKEMSK